MTAPTTTTTGPPARAAVNDIGKIVLLALAVICSTLLRFSGKLAETPYVGITVAVVGYLIGNGVNAVRGLPGSPALLTKGAEPALLVGAAGNARPVTPGPVLVVEPEPEPVQLDQAPAPVAAWPMSSPELPR